MSARKGMNLKQVKTNADRIRNMSDEELAEFLAYNAYCEECYVKRMILVAIQTEPANKSILNGLNQKRNRRKIWKKSQII